MNSLYDPWTSRRSLSRLLPPQRTSPSPKGAGFPLLTWRSCKLCVPGFASQSTRLGVSGIDPEQAGSGSCRLGNPSCVARRRHHAHARSVDFKFILPWIRSREVAGWWGGFRGSPQGAPALLLMLQCIPCIFLPNGIACIPPPTPFSICITKAGYSHYPLRHCFPNGGPRADVWMGLR